MPAGVKVPGLKEMRENFHQLIEEQASFISRHQLPPGAIPWYEGGITDPWDHVECAIALDMVGKFAEAARAYNWLCDIQNPDGSWYSSYLNDQPKDLTKDTNFSSYIATGAWHHYLATRDLGFLHQMWTTIEKSIAFTLHLQQPSGEIYWALDANGVTWPGALLAASSCTWQSIRNSIKIARVLGLEKPDWDAKSRRLARAIREHSELFNKFGENRQDYAINWYYPVLAGVIRGKEAKEHIFKHWEDFVIDNWGCKCVAHAPWVTVAETCELISTLSRISELGKARLLLDWILRLQDKNGGFSAGIKLPEQIIWPQEKTTWTSAAVVMAVSAQAKNLSRGGRQDVRFGRL